MRLMVAETCAAASSYVNFRDLLSWPQVGSYKVNVAGKGREGLGKREPAKAWGSAFRSHTGQTELLNVGMEETSHLPVEKQK